MGEMADFALDYVDSMEEYRLEYKTGHMDIQDAIDIGILDDRGNEPNPFYVKPCGPGACPICGKGTKEVKGKFGRFYGCIDFPECKGSRNFT